MATEEHVRIVEEKIGYSFKNKSQLTQALTAAGAVDENRDGNRKLALLGTSLTEFLFVYIAFEAAVPRGCTTDFRSCLTSVKRRALVATSAGIDKCIKYDKICGSRSSRVLAKAVNAIVAAVFLDCGENLIVVLGVMLRLGYFNIVDDKVIEELDQTSSNITSFVVALHRCLSSGTSAETSTVTSTNASLSLNLLDGIDYELSDEIVNHPNSGEMALTVEGDWNTLPGSIMSSQVVQSSPCNEIHSSPHQLSESLVGNPMPKRKLPFNLNPGKKTCLDRQDSRAGENVLPPYVSEEAGIQRNKDLSMTQETAVIIQNNNNPLELRNSNHDGFAQMALFIASPEALAVLLEMLQYWRKIQNLDTLVPTNQLSPAERFNMINNLDQTVPYLQLIRRYHILNLFRECGGPPKQATIDIVMSTKSDFESLRKQPGNPTNKAEAEIHENMMKMIFPTIIRDSKEYQTKYRKLKSLRRLGQRFHTLENKFGRGFLGLMPDCKIKGSSHPRISDNMISQQSESVFKEFISFLDETQGDILRQFSKAISGIVDALMDASQQECPFFGLENISKLDILECSKGSQALLDLVA